MEEIVERHLRVHFARNRARMKRAMVLIYADHFTVAELDRLAAIQVDPVMRKMQAEAPRSRPRRLASRRRPGPRPSPRLRAEIEAAAREYLKSKGLPARHLIYPPFIFGSGKNAILGATTFGTADRGALTIRVMLLLAHRRCWPPQRRLLPSPRPQ